MPICPHCFGHPEYRTISTAPGFPVEKCHTCKGEGTVTEEHADRILDGQTARAMRMSRDESLREMAKRVNRTPAQLSDMEIGRAPVQWSIYEGGK